MKIAIIGTGYVGLVTGTCFSELGNEVICVDNNLEKLEKLKSGYVPIYEPGLEKIFDENIKSRRLTFTDNLEKAIGFAEVIFLCLPTPPREDGSADLQYVLGVSEQIARLIKSYKVIVNKSTVPIGTNNKVKRIIKKITDVDFDIVSNPEFLREGTAVEDFLNPDRIVIGLEYESENKAKKILSELYKPLESESSPILFMDWESSEMTKYAANSFLSVKISFINEIANLCERVGADVTKVKTGIGSDPRIGSRFLNAGVGYGGSCFPKDVQALMKTAEEYHYDFKLLNSVIKVNNLQKLSIVEKILKRFRDHKNLQIAVWGLAFKPDTDDVRESPAISIIKKLLEKGVKIKAYDPEAKENFERFAMYYPDKASQELIEFVKDKYLALENSDALVIVTEWLEFQEAVMKKIKSTLKQPVVFDGRNIFDPEKIKKEGLEYYGVGRKYIG